MNKILAAIFLLASVTQLWGQSDSVKANVTSRKLHYSNSFVMGGLFGKEADGDPVTSLSTAMNHGIRYGRLASGVGVGVDLLGDWLAIPLYGYVSFDWAKMKNGALAIQFAGGYSDVWRPGDEDEGGPSYDSRDGGNYSAMLGYRINDSKYRIYIWAGYKYQRINYNVKPMYWGDFSVPAPVTSVEMDVNRFTIQLGFGWR